MEKKDIVGIKDVAKRANVGLATVDRVIHGRSGVSKKTREKVLKVIEELNYKPNMMASNLSKKKTFVLGVLLPNVSKESSYWGLPVKGVERAGKELQHYPVRIEKFLYDQASVKEMRKQILKVINSKIDGLVLTSKFAEETEILLQDCNEKNLPYIFIDSNERDEKAVCTIQQSLYESGQLAGQLFNYCFQEGNILVLFFKNIMDSEAGINKKIQGLNDFLKENDSLVKTRKYVISNFSQEQVDKELNKIFAGNENIKGVFIPNSRVGYMARYLHNNAMDRKVYLIGYDYLTENNEYLQKGAIDFLISQRPEEQGYKAIIKLFEHIVLKKNIEPEIFIPLDIITSKNYKYYLNYED
ncbi:LacI family DNA-binding transcriptional regulator [Abyssalbus ytuae]|uniref:LacI family transcriptional regulator n=1 Tax=Abyssalbus ytuae TaxID=2926907 RepID=A0A9E7D0G5_9FLAO|nr:LacI family DNA-binding transcriptional regulator [Abyssalbus ytuae]UOB18400.1 LacI family transcriptional regulator [Abyssalbus ytuae]